MSKSKTRVRQRSAEYATLGWIDWYSNRRQLEPIAHIPPAEAKEALYAAYRAPAMAA